MTKMIPDGTPSERARSFAGHSVKAAPDGQQYWQVDHSQYGAVTEAPMSKMALVSAGNLQASIQLIPSVTHGDKASVDLLEQFRKGLKGEMQTRGVKLSVLAFLVKALAKALQEMPKFNTSISADGQTLIQKHYVHIGIAVDTDYGLVVPVIRDADKKGIVSIAEEINTLAQAAKAKRLKAEQMGGASMSITSLGNIGGTYFTPIVNPPEVAILGVTPMVTEPVWNGTEFLPELRLPLDLSYDHRVINGADAARFTRKICQYLTEPQRLMV
jgi:pyruvate/2-oxoglutarate dehydrogenase complex dihydrolipoamide acyltransferase (E2) component